MQTILNAAAQAPTPGNQQVMLVFGYPTEQQKAREKPRRFDLKYIVHENAYHAFNGEELREMIAERTDAFDAQVQAFCERKYNSAFSREMSRSVRKWIDSLDTQEK